MEITLKEYTKNGIKLIAESVRLTSPEFDKVTDEQIVRKMVKHDFTSGKGIKMELYETDNDGVIVIC